MTKQQKAFIAKSELIERGLFHKDREENAIRNMKEEELIKIIEDSEEKGDES